MEDKIKLLDEKLKKDGPRLLYAYHTNPNWRKCLEVVNNDYWGVSTWTVWKKTNLGSKKSVYGFLCRLRDAGMIKGEAGFWRPVLIDNH